VDAAEILYANRDTNIWPLVRQIRYGAIDNLNQAYQDKTLPESEAYEAADAWYAFHCGQFQDFNDQIKIIRQNEGRVNENYFGGKEAFAKLLDLADPNRAVTSETNTPAK
jgi:hypothetical protein